MGRRRERPPPGKSLNRASQIHVVEPGLPSALLASRPDLLAVEYNLRAANANIGAVQASVFPSISLTGAYGLAFSAFGDRFKWQSKAWSCGTGLNLPILDWGRRKAGLSLSGPQSDPLLAAYRTTVQGAFQQVADALVTRQRYEEQLKAQTRTADVQLRLA